MCLPDFEDQVGVGITVFGGCSSHIEMTASSDRPYGLPHTTLIWFFVSGTTWYPLLFHAPDQHNFQDSPR
jgi:uncharacterized membrane protein YedE/YeeE